MEAKDAVPLPQSAPQMGDIYRHYKKGDRYRVVGYNFHANDHEWMIEYRPLYECPYPKFSRPLREWDEHVDVGGKTVARFANVTDETLR